MAHGRLLRQLIRAGVGASSDEFHDVAEQVIRDERQKKHHLLANDLERILYGESSGESKSLFSTSLAEVPTDRERQLPLLEIREPVRSFSDIVLSDENKHVLERVLQEQGRRDTLGMYGLKPITRLLFCGPPGCGKTLAAEVLATELGLPLVMIRFDAVVSSLLGETASNLRKVFDYLAAGRYVALFDEFDAIAKNREDPAEHGELLRVVNAFLQMMDAYRGNSLLVAASNHEGLLDKALWRRFDEVLFYRRPTADEVPTLITVKLRGIRTDFEEDSGCLREQFAGMAHADIERVLIRAIKQMILSGREFLTLEHVTLALERERERRIAADSTTS